MMKGKIFILEDDPERIKWFVDNFSDWDLTITNSAQAAISVLEWVKFDVFFLDHDLGRKAYQPSDENSGMEVVIHALKFSSFTNKIVIVHSWNTVAAKSMVEKIKEAEGVSSAYMPFGSFDAKVLKI